MLWSILSFMVISRYVLGAVQVQGRSMEGTLHDGDRRVVNHWIYFFREPRRGEMVVLNDHIDSSLCVKRIIALPGELIEFNAGMVFIDGQRLAEPYLATGIRTTPLKFGTRPIRLQKDQFFVLGDNRDDSVDSRIYGALQRRDIIGVIGQ
ncbi:MAG TPA: signal peptidase I [Verrucomicrobiae bacterium]